LLRGPEIQKVLAEQAKKIAGGGETDTYVAGTRAVAVSYSDKQDNAMLRRMG
jgi:hypothetical protein